MIVLTAIVVGMVLLLLTESYMAGMLKQMLEDQIGSHVAHVQIHKKGFNDNKIVQNSITDISSVEGSLGRNSAIAAFSRRVQTYGIASSASNSSGVLMIGVDAQQESRITKIRSWVQEGEYLSGKDREIVIGRALAERLGVTLGDKIVLMATALDGQVGSDVFRIVGLYAGSSSDFDKAFVYVPIRNAQRVLAMGDRVSEFVLLAANIARVPQLSKDLAAVVGEEYEVTNYKEVLPALMAIIEVADKSMGIYYFIIGVATIFGIINTLLMSVFERIREFGVLMAMGMKNGTVFAMIMLEALILGVVGTIIGLIVGFAVYLPYWHYGLNLSAFAEGLSWIGASTIVYPLLTSEALVRIVLIIPFISVLAALYPATKAIRLVPVRAIYYV